MEHRIVQKNGKWYCKWTDADKVQHQSIIKGAASIKEAEKIALIMLSQNNMYLFKKIAEKMYLPESEHMKRLEAFGKKLDPATAKQKRSHIEFFLKEFGNFDIRTLQPSRIMQFLLDDKKHSASYKNNFLDTISTIYTETTWKCDKQIPCPHFQRFSRHSKKSDSFTEEELKRFLSPDSFTNYAYCLFFNLMVCCGLRLGETCGIKVKQFVWNEHALIVDGFCKLDGTRTNYNKKGSDENKKIRVVPVPKVLERIILEYKDRNKIDENSFLFCRPDKTPFTEYRMIKVFNKALERAGIEKNERKLTPHSLRYTFITYMRSVLDGDEVRKIAGHTDIVMTDYYTRFLLQNEIRGIKESFSAVDNVFNPVCLKYKK